MANTWSSILTMVIILISLVTGVMGLRMIRVTVPEYVQWNEDVTLQCEYDLQHDRLYSVSWYKDHEEFYRYVPKSATPQLSYKIDDIKVDHRHSDGKKVVLKNVNLHMGGWYRCEVSAEAPSFATIHGDARMEVIYTPDEGPRISGEQEKYQIGDTINLNCTSGPSFPVTKLRWFINDKLVKSSVEMILPHHSLTSAVARLELKAGPEHFVDGQMKIKCQATITVGNGHDSIMNTIDGPMHQDNRINQEFYYNNYPTIASTDYYQKDALISLKGSGSAINGSRLKMIALLILRILLYDIT